METLLGIALGLALAAACGFRVFVPLLALGAAEASGYLTLSSGFDWLGSPPALIAFGVATAAEISAYYVPWLDHLLDAIAAPAAVVAGIVVTASAVAGMDPFWRWTLAIIAGGGLAGTVHGSTSLLRAVSTGTTGGLANPLVATVELGSSLAISVLALLVPLLALATVAIGLGLTIAWVRRHRAAGRLGRGPGGGPPRRAAQLP